LTERSARQYRSISQNPNCQQLDAAGIAYSVLIKDWQEYYSEQQAADVRSLEDNEAADVPKYFRYGAMGGFLILNESVPAAGFDDIIVPFVGCEEGFHRRNE
jgi:hypothetical protein